MNQISNGVRGGAGRRGPSWVRTGGAMGVAACVIGLGIFLGACAGFGGAFNFSPLPVVLGVIGLGLSLGGAIFQKSADLEETAALGALFANVLGLIGGSLLVVVWMGWPIFGGK